MSSFFRRLFGWGGGDVAGGTGSGGGTGGGFVVRPMRAEDAGAVVRIYNVSVMRTVATFQTSPDTERRRLAWLRAHTGAHPAFAAELDGEVVGWCALSPYSQREAWSRTVEDSVYLDERFHGRGFGGRLLARLLESAAALGHRVVLARIVASHAASIALHRKFGFREQGRLTNVGFKFGRWHDVAYLARDLGGGGGAGELGVGRSVTADCG